MSKETPTSPYSLFLQELFRVEIYKRTQGKLTRQVTCIAIWVTFAVLAWRMMDTLSWSFADAWFTSGALYFKYGVPLVVLLAGIWIGYRVVNYAPFSDFLIAVEAEMNKVSWPTQTELVRSSIVVIVMIVTLTFTVFVYDLLLRYLLIVLTIVPKE